MKPEVIRESKEEMMETGWVKQWIMCGNINGNMPEFIYSSGPC